MIGKIQNTAISSLTVGANKQKYQQNPLANQSSSRMDTIEISKTSHTTSGNKDPYDRITCNRLVIYDLEYKRQSGENWIQHGINDTLKDYYNGKMSMEDLKKSFKDTVDKVYAFDIEKGFASPDDKDHIG